MVFHLHDSTSLFRYFGRLGTFINGVILGAVVTD